MRRPTRSFGAAQGKAGEANLDQQRIGADRALGHDAHRLARHEAQLTQATGNRIVQAGGLDGTNQRLLVVRQRQQGGASREGGLFGNCH